MLREGVHVAVDLLVVGHGREQSVASPGNRVEIEELRREVGLAGVDGRHVVPEPQRLGRHREHEQLTGEEPDPDLPERGLGGLQLGGIRSPAS